MQETGKITRKVILLRHCLNDHEECKAALDFDVVRSFLKSAAGGCFSDEEIGEYPSVFFDRERLFELLDSYDYLFVYFSGHSSLENRLVQIPLKNGEVILESEFIRPKKKQWIFLDCSRSSKVPIKSPDFELPRIGYFSGESSSKKREDWFFKLSQMEPFYLIYHVTKLGGFAHSNDNGGYGTQLFFTKLIEELHSEETFDFEQFVRKINYSPIIGQESSYVPSNLDLKAFSSLF